MFDKRGMFPDLVLFVLIQVHINRAVRHTTRCTRLRQPARSFGGTLFDQKREPRLCFPDEFEKYVRAIQYDNGRIFAGSADAHIKVCLLFLCVCVCVCVCVLFVVVCLGVLYDVSLYVYVSVYVCVCVCVMS